MDVENYRPISNLCSSSKIFEKLILEIQDDQNVDITGKSQHGFKKNRSTASLSLTIQTIISHALEDDCNAVMVSLDLSAAFDTVNIKLLLKRMRIIGLSEYLVGLVKVWLKERCFYKVPQSLHKCYHSNKNLV